MKKRQDDFAVVLMEDAEGEVLRLTEEKPESAAFKAGSTEKNLTPQMMLVSSVDYSDYSNISSIYVFLFFGPIFWFKID